MKVKEWAAWNRPLTNEELAKVSTGDIPPELTPDHYYSETIEVVEVLEDE